MEQGIVLPASDRALPLTVCGPLSVQELIGRPVHDQLSLTLGRAAAYVARQDLAGGDAVFAVVLGQALGRRALMDLLYTLAPYKAHGPDRFARVLDNWGLHDRALSSSASDSLLQQHARSLRSSWHEFSRHRRSFMSVFEDQAESTRLLPVVTWERSAAGIRRWRFAGLDQAWTLQLESVVPVLRESRRESTTETSSLLGLVAIPYFLPELHRKWQAWRPLVRDGKSNYIGPASVPMMALLHRRALLNSVFISGAEAVTEARSS